MPAQATLDEVWATIRETDRQIQETNRQMQETDRRMQELERDRKERSRRVDEQIARVDAQIAEVSRIVLERDRTESSRRVDEQIAETLRIVGDLGGKWGKFVEGMVAPACETLFTERGIPVHRVYQRARVRVGGRSMEIDILVINGDHVVAVEVKSTLRVEDVRDHLERLAEFKTFFPEFAGRQVLGAVAGMVIEEDADRFAYRQGLFVLAQSGDNVRLLNDEKFRPRSW